MGMLGVVGLVVVASLVVVAAVGEERKEAGEACWMKNRDWVSPSAGDVGATLAHGQWRAWGAQQNGLTWWDQPET